MIAKRKVLPPLKNPYGGKSRPPLQRHMSVPVREKNLPEALEEKEEIEEPSAFKFA